MMVVLVEDGILVVPFECAPVITECGRDSRVAPGADRLVENPDRTIENESERIRNTP